MTTAAPGRPHPAVTVDTGPAARPRERWQAVVCDDTGSAAVEQVLATGLLLLVLGMIVTGGQYWHATHIAQAAATRALEAARAEHATTADGTAQGEASLDALGRTLLRDRTVRVTRTATEVRVEITATAAGLVPLPVRVVRSGPVERWVPAR